MRYSTTKESYSEVFEIIKLLDEDYKKKIPKKLYKFIEENRDKNYIPDFSNENINCLNSKSISRKAVAILAFLNQRYWNDNEEKNKKLAKIYAEDQERFKEEVRECYNNELICNSEPSIDTEENILPSINDFGVFDRLKRKIWNILHKKNN